MKKFPHNSLLILSIVFLSKITCFPCPNECICKSTQINVDYKQIRYTIDCTNADLPSKELIYRAPSWSFDQDQISDDPYDHERNEYIISIVLSNITSLNNFNNQTIQLTGFPFTIESLSLTQLTEDFLLQSNSFQSDLYEDLRLLNLSACCRRIPNQCSTLFQRFKHLEILDLSSSNLYTTCLNTPDPISTQLHDLILRNNQYSATAFSRSSQLFTGVRHIAGKLDLQNSFFNFTTTTDGNCLFDQFTRITILDLSSIQFPLPSNHTDIYLKHLLFCKTHSSQTINGKQLIELYLRQINLQYLPLWFRNDRFPLLNLLDLSSNQIHSIDIQTFSSLKTFSLAYNPIQFENIQWRSNEIHYKSLNLRSTISKQLFYLTDQLENLLKLSSVIDFSENFNGNRNYLSNLYANDFDQISLNLSRTNIYLFDIDDISNFENLYSLDISWNFLKELILEKQLKLIYVDCSNQKLERIVFHRDLSSLVEFKCSNNSLRTIENLILSNQENLKSIDLSFNEIDSLENLFANLSNRYLQTINLKSNSIEKIPTNQFNIQLVSLYSVDLSYNKINFIEKFAFQSPNLQILDLTGNPLKNIENNFLLTSSLRLFYLINNTQQLITRCAQSKSSDLLLSNYLAWFEQNGTYMKTIDQYRSQQIQFDKCLRQYRSRSKTKWMKFNEKLHIQHLSLYITTCAISIGLILGVIYMYKKNQWNFWRKFQHYRPLDRNSLIDSTGELGQQTREDDEIVMNLSESPFNIHDRS